MPFGDVGLARREAGARLLLGTQRVTEPVGVAGEWKGLVEGGRDGSEAFGRVLGALYLVGEAGRGVSEEKGAVVEAAPREEKRLCSEGMNELLVKVFGQEPSLVPVWCDAAVKMGVLPWPEHVPGLLSHAANMPGGSATAKGIVQSAGLKAAWLIGLNPAWKKLSGTAEGVDGAVWHAWDEMTGDRRVRVFEAMRMENPAMALEKLMKAWPDEPGESRLKLLDGLKTGLSMGDEAFVEGLLDDKRKTVREKGAEILRGIEGSRLVERMKARLKEHVKKSGGGWSVEPSDVFDKEMARDGMTDKPGIRGMGVKAWLLYQMTAATPLGVWQEITGAEPEKLVAWAVSSDWHESLWTGWLESFRRKPDPLWTVALVERNAVKGDLDAAGKMLAELDPAKYEEVLGTWVARDLASMKAHAGRVEYAALTVAQETKAAWSAKLTETFIQLMATYYLRADGSAQWRLKSMMRPLADAFDAPTALECIARERAAIAGDVQDGWVDLFKNVTGKLEIRAAIHKEMSK